MYFADLKKQFDEMRVAWDRDMAALRDAKSEVLTKTLVIRAVNTSYSCCKYQILVIRVVKTSYLCGK